MANESHHGDIFIIKKKISGGGGHHGGAWKIAFADFMTAMMAFFLVLWIINATDKETKTVIARYFNPVKLENPSKATKGVHGASSAPTEGKEATNELPPGPPSKKKDAKGAPEPASGTGKKKDAPPASGPAIEAKIQAAEALLFSDPYEALDRIVGGQENAAPGASADNGDADPQRLAGALSIDSFRDPFKPIGPGSPDDPNAFDADARQKAPPNLEPGKTGPDEQLNVRPTPGATPSQQAREKLGPGAPAEPAPSPPAGRPETGKVAESPEGAAEAAKLEQALRAQVKAALKSAAGPEIEAHQTPEGLLISLTDSLAFSMFSVGSAEPRPELVRAMEAIAKVIRTKPGHIVVRGHTDARPYRNGAYDNWRLSSDRAQMAYYMLTRGGAPAARFVRVEGYADRALKDPAQPLSAVNRRLEILIEAAKP